MNDQNRFSIRDMPVVDEAMKKLEAKINRLSVRLESIIRSKGELMIEVERLKSNLEMHKELIGKWMMKCATADAVCEYLQLKTGYDHTTPNATELDILLKAWRESCDL